MPNVSERFPKDADSASVEMVGGETVEHASVRLYNVYNFSWSYTYMNVTEANQWKLN